MATILTKRSNTASSVPVAGDLTNSTGGAELAVNTADKRLFTKDSGGTVVELGTNPSSVTLPNGTANGVPYLNGSKVLTSGSALTFDGTLFKVAGYADFSTSNTLCRISSNATSIFIGDNSIGAGSGYGISSSSAYLYFQAYGSEQMRLTSTGLGIGTSSPNTRVHAYGSSGNTYIQAARATQSTGEVGFQISGGTSGADWYMYQPASSNNLYLYGNGATRLILDTSGNLGLGVTPSAWPTPTGTQALQIGSGGVSILGGGSGWSAAAFMYLSNNAYYSSSAWRYLRSVPSAQYVQASGEHQWFTAPSGTAGNAISFTQAMTLDASGNLGVGTTSPGTRLDVSGNLRFSAANPVIELNNGGAQIYSTVANTLQFASGGGIGSPTERARIDSSGNLLVGTTSGSAPNPGIAVNQGTNSAIQIGHGSAAVSGSSFAVFRYNGTAIGYIDQNGTTGVTFATSSDYRLKENIQPMTGALAKVAALKPCTYKWKADGSDGEGFIAHELAEVVPHAVTGEKDAVDEDGNPKYQGIDTSFLVATLTAAIQEQQAIINSLKARLDAANL